jgi:hypothetical protein
MKLQSVTIMAIAGGCFLMATPVARAQTQPQPQGQSQAQPEAPAAASGQKRSIVGAPSNAGNAAVQSAVQSTRDAAARKAKEREMR